MAAPTRRNQRRPGRPAGETGNRDAILRAAQREFARRGYDAATIRSIAARAGVDPALVHHYFGNKVALFAEAHRLPVNPLEMLPQLLSAPRDRLGETIIRFSLGRTSPDGDGGALVGLLRAAASHDAAARMLREFVSKEILGPLAESLDVPDPQLRASLVGSQLVGLVFARNVVRIPALVEADDETLVAWYAPTLQRYLTAPDATATTRCWD